MDSLDDLAEHVQSFLHEITDDHYSVFLIDEGSIVKMVVVRLPSHGSEQFYKIEKSFDPGSKTTVDLILLARMCVVMIERELTKNA